MEIIYGPPGTGKTTTLLKIVEDEINSGTHPSNIAYLTFTKKAAREAVTRAMDKFGLPSSEFPWFRTLHSLCFRHMGVDPADMFNSNVLKEFGQWVGVPIDGKINYEQGTTQGTQIGDRCLFMYNLARVRGVPLREMYLNDNDGLSWRIVDHVSRGIDEYKRRYGYADYTDLLERFLREDDLPKPEVLILDEAQDLSDLQWRIVDRIRAFSRRCVVAGDDDQAIFEWAGADVSRFLNLSGTRTILAQSWRVPKTVQEVAQKIVSRISKRAVKEYRPREASGIVGYCTELRDVDWSGSDILILSRNEYILKEVRAYLRNKGIIYTYRGDPAVDPKVMQAVEMWEGLRKGGLYEAADVRTMYRWLRLGSGVRRGFKTLPGVPDDLMLSMNDLVDRYGLMTRAPWFDALELLPAYERDFIRTARRNGEKFKEEPRVKLSTIHGVKGGQAEHVVLLSDIAARTMREYHKYPDSEHRVWYVGTTRSRNVLTILTPRTGNHYVL